MSTQKVPDYFSTSAALTITLANLASSTAGVGRQTTMVDNSSTKYPEILLYILLTLGTSPTGSKAAYIYLIRGDKDGTTPHRDLGAGASDAGITIPTHYAVPILTLPDKASPATNDELRGSCRIIKPGPEWGIAVVHDTGVALKNDATAQWIRWVGVEPDVQAAA